MKLFDKLLHAHPPTIPFSSRCFSLKNKYQTDHCSYREIDVLEAFNLDYMSGARLRANFETIVEDINEDIQDQKKDNEPSNFLLIPAVTLYKKYHQSILNHLPKIMDNLIKKGLVTEHFPQHKMNLAVSCDIEFPVIRDGKITSVIKRKIDYEPCQNEFDVKMLVDEVEANLNNIEINARTKLSKVSINLQGTLDGAAFKETYDNTDGLEKFNARLTPEVLTHSLKI